jgi:hypothetical protein
MRTLQFGVAMCNLGPRLPQTEAQGLEQSLALPNTEVDAKLPPQIGAQRFPVPKVGGQPGLLGWFPQNLPNDLQVLISQASRPTRATPLLKASQPGTFKVSNPILQCAWSVPKDVGCLPAGHALRDKQDSMQTVIVAGLIRPADLVLQRQNENRCIGDRQWPHTNMKPLFCSVRK